MKKTKRSILILWLSLIVLFTCANSFSNIPAAGNAFRLVSPNDWDRYKTNDGEFSVFLAVVAAMSSYSVRMTNIPQSPLRHLICAYEDCVVYAIYVFDRKQSLDDFISTFRHSVASDFKRDLKVDGIPGKEYTFGNEDRRATTQYFATERKIYVFEACGSFVAQPQQRVTKILGFLKFSLTARAQRAVDG